MSFFDVGSFFCGLAAAVLVFLLYRLLGSLYNIVFPYLLLSPIDLHKKAGAKWAAVTGSTDGIGRAYSFELARKGFSIILISRTQSKLDKTKQEILREVPNVEVETFSFDLSSGVTADYKPLTDYLLSKDIGILVNNVGGMSNYPDILHKCEGGPTKLDSEVNINILPTTILCAAVLPQMVSRKSGIIVNVSSAASFWKFRGWAIYCSSKKYVSWLTAILQKEYEDSGIIIQCLVPMLVATKLAKVDQATFFGPNADSFVKQAVRTIGLAQETTGYITHQIQYEGSRYMPELILDYVISKKNEELLAKAQKQWAKCVS